MKPVGFLLASLIFSVLSSGCEQSGGDLPGRVLVRINEESVTLEEFNREFRELVLEPGKGVRGGDAERLKMAYLDQMIERKILVQEARRLGIGLSSEELRQAMAEVKKDYPEEGFDKKLGLEGVSADAWEKRLEEKLLAEKMMRRALLYSGEIEEKELRDYYEQHRSSFRIQERVRARQIIVPDGEEALQILKRLKRGERFENLAREKSVGPEREEGGDLGYFSPGERPPEFDHVFTMNVGAISEVIQSAYGYHIFKLEDKIGPREIPFEEARPQIVEKLRQKKGEEAYQKWLREMREKAKVKINRRLLRS